MLQSSKTFTTAMLRRPSPLLRHTAPVLWRAFAVAAVEPADNLADLRNIGISAHIDSGKTTLTERILFYSGRIRAIHEVRGKDGVGAKMDSMELEREKGITIKSAATYTSWKDFNINIIDTPGHVDFTVEVERALRVLDGAVMVLCGVAGVQSQSITVDRQMKRYEVPRLAFINKLDRAGADPWRVITDIRSKLGLNAVAVQVPIGMEKNVSGVVDLIRQKAYVNVGENGETVDVQDIPAEFEDLVREKRQELIERVADLNDEVAEAFLMEEEPTEEQLVNAIRECTIARTLIPVFMGSAFKNKGVQALLDGVTDYLPAPDEIKNIALDLQKKEEKIELAGDAESPLVAYAFKLEDGKYGQLTYIRVYQGTLSKGQFIRNTSTGKKVKVSRLVRMHSDEMEEVNSVGSGEICALFGIECSSGDTFCDDKTTEFTPSMVSMFVPASVISLAVSPKNPADAGENFSKALQRFTKEDPTFRVSVDAESKETLISGMGELHLEVYLERMKREYNVETVSGAPQVNYRETVGTKTQFNYLHKKQTGGSGQYGRVVGYMEPLDPEEAEGKPYLFENQLVGNAIPPEYVNAIENGFIESLEKGPQVGHPVQGVKFVLTDGQAHSNDSSDLAFRAAARGAFREAFKASTPLVLEPIMEVHVEVPDEYQGGVVGSLNRRRGTIQDSETRDGYATIRCLVPLSEMFGYSTELRSMTQAKGEFTMEFKEHRAMGKGEQKKLMQEYQDQRAAEMEKKK